MRVIFSILCICGFIVSLNSVAFAKALQYLIEPVIYADEADGHLEGHAHSCLNTTFAEFTARGGTLVRLDKNTVPFQLLPRDMVFPSCSGGNNRSQTLWNVLRSYSHKITLMPPHATRHGFDPYNGRSNWSHNRIQKTDEYVLWAGVSKCQKLGWNVFERWLSKSHGSPEALTRMADYYNRHYYNPDCPEGTRRIYITFAENAHVHLYRLCQTNASLENVVVLFFPLEDLIHNPLSKWRTYPYSVKCYVELSAKIRAYLDFSQLEKPKFVKR
jgi:hypothetical protein